MPPALPASNGPLTSASCRKFRHKRWKRRSLRRAIARAALENLSCGLPVIQWREDRGVVAVPAERLAPLTRRILEVNGEPLPEAEDRTWRQGVP